MTLNRRTLLAALPLLAVAACDRDPERGVPTTAPPAPEPLGPMLKPADLVQRLDDVKSGKLVVLYVGPDVLYRQARIPGARLLPETSTEAGRAALTRELDATPKDTEIVVYCGCCPYRSCQNVRPASQVIRASGRTNAKYLDLPINLKTDWTSKGYPVERG